MQLVFEKVHYTIANKPNKLTYSILHNTTMPNLAMIAHMKTHSFCTD